MIRYLLEFFLVGSRRLGIGLGAGIVLAAAPALAQQVNYRSIGSMTPVVVSGLNIGAGATVLTFPTDYPETVGVGDQVQIGPGLGGETAYVSARISTTELEISPAPVNAHTGEDITISRAYANMYDWESARQGNLVAGDLVEVGVLRNDAVLTLTSVVDIEGSTVDATHYMALIADDCSRHDGIAGGGVVLDGAGRATAFTIRQDFTHLAGLELIGFTGTGVSVNVPNIEVRDMLIHGFDAGATAIRDTSATNLTVANSMIWDGGVGVRTGAGTVANIVNTTMYGLDTGVQMDDGTVTVESSAIIASTTADILSTAGTLSQTANFTTDGSASGAGSQSGVTAADLFVSVGSTIDLHLHDGATAIDQGVDSATANGVDIDRQVRPLGASDIGADEWNATPGPGWCPATNTTPGPSPTPTATPTPGPGGVPGGNFSAFGGGCSCALSPSSPPVRPIGILLLAALALLVRRRATTASDRG